MPFGAGLHSPSVNLRRWSLEYVECPLEQIERLSCLRRVPASRRLKCFDHTTLPVNDPPGIKHVMSRKGQQVVHGDGQIAPVRAYQAATDRLV